MPDLPQYTTSYNDFRSDTFTIPTPDMFAAGANASVGDVIFQEDACTCLLEQRVSQELLGGKLYGGSEAQGLFCMSTTMSNQIAIRAHLNFAPPFSILCDKRAHVYVDECAGIAVLSQALVVPVAASNDRFLTLEDIQEAYIPDDGDIHLAPTRLICLENTLHGMCFPYEELKRISDWCHEEGIKLHLDGARFWNAACSSGEDPVGYMRKVGPLFDSLSLCFSKSLGAPIGSMLVGGPEFRARARHLLKQQGGGIRQAGFITKIAAYCLDRNFPQAVAEVSSKTLEFWEDLYTTLKDKYAMELRLAHPVETNFIFIDLASSGINMSKFLEIGERNNVRLFDGRLAFHYQNIKPEGLALLKKTFTDVAEYYQKNDYKPEGRSTRIY
ncbi:Low specificity L-threonine aldolase [Lachancea thermotolerans]|uniref:low-specificity L-threonine aldolase n=1 Tax=Lachancea thermotolerans (strain ATCC 56472 / CBS 6340 / NRRL Y-8284) TaxID=559295 RepID=C5DIJ8_LACTC|nr:KLTH0E13090p [Lachancea thermotolerans CBS 6340]CAR23609.1 KLTH0E13090p [Lachancea thermotolerans CBS 6340]